MKYYPAFLDLKDKKAIVVGGGKVASRKAVTLLKAGASVTVVSPEITSDLRKLRDKGRITHLERKYMKGDVDKAFIVIAATPSADINSLIAEEAGSLVNVVNRPLSGNYISSSLVTRGPLSIAISTEGISPAVSKAVRKEIESYFGPEFAQYLRFIEKVRKKAIKNIHYEKKREEFLKSLASEERFQMLRSSGFETVSSKVLEELEKAL